jgi:hypothetical protein
MWNFLGALNVVAGQSLYRVNAAGGWKKIGTGIPGTNVLSMSNNTTQLIITNGVTGYIADTSDVFQQITSPNFFSANTVLFFDNYFLLDHRETNQFFWSALADGLSYNSLDFASAEAKPGFLTAVKENLQLIFLFAQNHIEMWYDAGTPTQPFQRYAGAVIERGCGSPQAIINQDDALFFLGVDRVFYRLQGNVPIRVSNHGVEKAFQSYGDISDAFCFTYTLEGHKMVHLTFPSVPHSWVFDISTGKWHERDSLDANANSLGRWRGNCAIEIYDKILIGDAFSGKIFALDWENFTEDGNPMRALAHSATLHADKQRLFIGRLELDMDVGNATATGQGSNPHVLLRWSKDGGVTWSKIQPPRSIGKVGQRLRRVRWITLGQAYQWTFELVVTDPVKRVLIATHVDSEAGTS